MWILPVFSYFSILQCIRHETRKKMFSFSRKASGGDDQKKFCLQPQNLNHSHDVDNMRQTVILQDVHPHWITEKSFEYYWAQKATLLAAVAAEENSLIPDRAVFCQVSLWKLSTEQVFQCPGGSRNPQTGLLSICLPPAPVPFPLPLAYSVHKQNLDTLVPTISRCWQNVEISE